MPRALHSTPKANSRAATRPRSPALLRSTAFTLLELLAVIVILSLIATAVSITLAQSAHTATFTATLDQVASFDHITRRAAIHAGKPATLTIDPQHQAITRGKNTLHLAAAHLDRIRLLPGEDTTATLNIPINADGRSPTYALRFIGPDQRITWLVVLGLTGQTTTYTTDEDADKLFDMLHRRPPPEVAP